MGFAEAGSALNSNDVDAAFGNFLDLDAAEDFDMLTRVKEAIISGRIDLYLQPIVSLPSRSTRFFEAFSRLRDAQGQILLPGSYLEAAERAHRIAIIDNLILTRSIEALRIHSLADKGLVVFCNISPSTIFDENCFDRFASYMEGFEDLAERIVFEFTLPSVHMMHPRVEQNMKLLAEQGFAFSVDHVHALNLDWASLREKNFRYAKTSARMLFGNRAVEQAERAKQALENQRREIADAGIELIVEKIERQEQFRAAVDAGFDYAQGHLFGAARPAEHYLPVARALT
ncbi:MAG: EAL domain-containing protein [Pseudomonadota bacterium]